MNGNLLIREDVLILCKIGEQIILIYNNSKGRLYLKKGVGPKTNKI